MPSVTTWTRLEPRTRNEDISLGLQARIHDPLWLLARQWQMGEFKAEDGGSVITARWQAEAAYLTRYRAGHITPGTVIDSEVYDSSKMALETLVEREGSDREDLRLKLRTGLYFIRLLNEAGLTSYVKAYIARYALTPPSKLETATYDTDTVQFLNLMANRSLDGYRLYLELRAALHPSNKLVKPLTPAPSPALPLQPAIKPVDQPKVREIASKWLQWYETILAKNSGSSSAWDTTRLEYEFAVAGRSSIGEVVLSVPEYSNGNLDWYAFDIYNGASLAASANTEQITRTAIPMPVSYPGMPATRWWEFEDAAVDFSNLQADPEELAKLLLLEFTFVYGNDWFILPLELKVGAICRTLSLVVTNSFGEQILISSGNGKQEAGVEWSMFQLSADRANSLPLPADRREFLFLPPVLARSLHGVTLEEVVFLRDEMANMAWAIEKIIETPLTQPLSRQVNAKEEHGMAPTNKTALAYRLATTLPSHWYPLQPFPLPNGGIEFRLGSAANFTPHNQLPPQSVLLQGEKGKGLIINEEEIAKSRIRVTRNYQYARWSEGSSHLWVGRKKEPAPSQPASGLAFDLLEPMS